MDISILNHEDTWASDPQILNRKHVPILYYTSYCDHLEHRDFSKSTKYFVQKSA